MANKYLKILNHEIKHSFTDNKWIIITVSLIFLLALIIGFIFAKELQPLISPALNAFQQKIQSGEVQLTTNSLYLNNIKATLAIFAGSAAFGIIGISSILVNALMIGYYGALYYLNSQIVLFFALILPHGIFEIPSLIIASSAGFILLKFILKFLINLFSPDYTYTDIFDPLYNLDKINTVEKIKMSWRKNGKFLKHAIILLIISTILLIIAAFVEANLTREIASMIVNSI